MSEKTEYIITCQQGLEEVLKGELEAFGVDITDSSISTVKVMLDDESLYKLNMGLRTAINILKPLKTFNCSSTDILYFQSKKINWHKIFGPDKTMRIDVKGQSLVLTNSQYVVHRVKDSICDTFRKFHDSVRPSVSKDNPDIHIVVYLNGKEVTVNLDSSGTPLFKRGYRDYTLNAPIKEDLAAGILLLSDWDKKQNVLDPMCGSGTFLIESYYINTNTPPNLDRKFSFMNWVDYNEKAYKSAYNELKSAIKKTDTKFYGFEIDKKTFATSKKIIQSLNLDKFITIENKDYRNSNANYKDFFIVANPPYGERLESETDLSGFYKDIGDFLKKKCTGSNASIFTANLKDSKFIGLRSDKRITLYNGGLEARLIKFKLF